jgi:hypothetical protein
MAWLIACFWWPPPEDNNSVQRLRGSWKFSQCDIHFFEGLVIGGSHEFTRKGDFGIGLNYCSRIRAICQSAIDVAYEAESISTNLKVFGPKLRGFSDTLSQFFEVPQAPAV